MADIRQTESPSDLYWTGLHQKQAGHDMASLNAHNPANAPKRAWVGVEQEIAGHIRRGEKITDWKDGRYYFSGDFGAVVFKKEQVGEDFFAEVVIPNLKA